MKHQKLDEFIKGKLSGSVPPPSDMWSRIEKSLDGGLGIQKPAVHKKKVFKSYYAKIISTGIAASLIVSISMLFYKNEHTDIDTAHPDNISHNQTIIPAPPIQVPQNNIITNDKNSSIKFDDIIDNNSIIRNNQYAHNFNAHSNLKNNKSNFDLSFTDIDEIEKTISKQLHQNNYSLNSEKLKDNLTQTQPSHIGMSSDLTNKSQIENNINIPIQTDINIVVNDKNYIKNKTSHSKKNADFAIGGGYNYGTLDQGYALTLSTKKDLNNKWFIEGNMGIVYNEAGDNQSKYAGDFLSLKRNMKSNPNTAMSETRFHNPSNYVFVQMNPIFGYRINKKFNIGIGPDYQQLINNMGQDIIYFPVMSSGKLLPRSDFGVLGKAEFSFSNRMKAGIIYREGMTSYIRNNINIQNRSYFQLQLNYILHKK